MLDHNNNTNSKGYCNPRHYPNTTSYLMLFFLKPSRIDFLSRKRCCMIFFGCTIAQLLLQRKGSGGVSFKTYTAGIPHPICNKRNVKHVILVVICIVSVNSISIIYIISCLMTLPFSVHEYIFAANTFQITTVTTHPHNTQHNLNQPTLTNQPSNRTLTGPKKTTLNLTWPSLRCNPRVGSCRLQLCFVG